jgi:hypothetical protein
MCGYELYVAEELYDEYYDAIITHTKDAEGEPPQKLEIIPIKAELIRPEEGEGVPSR